MPVSMEGNSACNYQYISLQFLGSSCIRGLEVWSRRGTQPSSTTTAKTVHIEGQDLNLIAQSRLFGRTS